MKRIVDCHSHILPGIDDGSRSVEQSIEMLKREAAQGITHVIATPHFYADQDTPERFLARRDRAEQILRKEMEKHVGLPRLTVGTEVYFFPGISESDVVNQLTIDGKSSILLEMPYHNWTDRMYGEVEDLAVRRGFLPVIAHVDRYISPWRTHGIPNRLAELPVIVQANAGFFLKRNTRNMALRMLKAGQIHVLGSDCHNLDSRPPNLDAARQVIRNRLGEKALERIWQFETEILPE